MCLGMFVCVRCHAESTYIMNAVSRAAAARPMLQCKNVLRLVIPNLPQHIPEPIWFLCRNCCWNYIAGRLDFKTGISWRFMVVVVRGLSVFKVALLANGLSTTNMTFHFIKTNSPEKCTWCIDLSQFQHYVKDRTFGLASLPADKYQHKKRDDTVCPWVVSQGTMLKKENNSSNVLKLKQFAFHNFKYLHMSLFIFSDHLFISQVTTANHLPQFPPSSASCLLQQLTSGPL